MACASACLICVHLCPSVAPDSFNFGRGPAGSFFLSPIFLSLLLWLRLGPRQALSVLCVSNFFFGVFSCDDDNAEIWQKDNREKDMRLREHRRRGTFLFFCPVFFC